MNLCFVSRLLGIVALLLGCSMLFSLPWAAPAFGGEWEFESKGVFGLTCSVFICFAVGALLRFYGRKAEGQLFRKEGIAVVALSWVLATVLGAMPYYLSGTARAENTPMSLADCLFESQSGISTTGATVIGDVENPKEIARCILFWRSTTHFLGGLGIMVLFVAILGQGSAGKVMMRLEMTTGPQTTNPHARMRQTASILLGVYLTLNAVLIFLLLLEGVPPFDAICHSFGAIATGGFSTFNSSVGHFAESTDLNAPLIEWTLILFMFLGGANFMLLYMLALGRFQRFFSDTELRVYFGIIAVATVLIFLSGLAHGDFPSYGNAGETISWYHAIRHSVFHVVSILTTTGYCTNEFEKWNALARGVTLALMFFGACAGSTSGGIKIIRHIIGWKILKYAIEHSFRPSVVRSLKVSSQTLDKDIVQAVPIHFFLVGVLFVVGTLVVLTLEPTRRWETSKIGTEHKLVDVGSAVAATLNNVGPGLGIVGARQNFGGFTEISKFLFVWLMMLGRLELFAVLALFYPSFWRSHS